MKHGVQNIELGVREPNCLNKVIDVEDLTNEVVEGFEDSEDDRAIATIEKFHLLFLHLFNSIFMFIFFRINFILLF